MLRDRRFDEEGTAYCFSLSLGTRLYTGSRKIGRGYFHDKNHGFGGSRTLLEYVWDRKRGSSTTVLGIFIRGPRTSVPLELRCRINWSRGEWRVYGKWGNLKLRRSWNFFFFFFVWGREMLSIGINPFMKKLESFFRYLWIFSRKEKK